MSFKSRLTDDLVRIAAAGCGFRLDATVRTSDDLVRIAAVASRGSARLFLYGLSGRTTDDLVRTAAAGGGSVIFED